MFGYVTDRYNFFCMGPEFLSQEGEYKIFFSQLFITSSTVVKYETITCRL